VIVVPDGSIPAELPRALNRYDQYALDQAVDLRDQTRGEITILSVGPATVREVLSRGLALGADRAIHVSSETTGDSGAVAAVLATEAERLRVDLVLVGQESSDGGTGSVGPLVAALWGGALVSNVRETEVDNGVVTLRRDVETGSELVVARLPLVVAMVARTKEPRLPGLKGIMAARKKEIEGRPLNRYDAPANLVAWGQPQPPERRAGTERIEEFDPATAARLLVSSLRGRRLI
jgi:electron transfer flavoprotein beta subunit